MEIGPRTYYTHSSECSAKQFYEPNARGLRICKECAGIFDEDGKGVAVTDKRFDENYEAQKAAVEADHARGTNG